MQDVKPDWAIYLLSRSDDNDLPSLNRGKAQAQSHHAGVQLAIKFHDHPHFRAYIESGIAQGADAFNTTLTMRVTLQQITVITEIAQKLGYIGHTIMDPSYPYITTKEVATALGAIPVAELSNGNVVLTRPEITCGYILGDRNDRVFRALTANLELLK
jgi:hypothetical protein